MRRRYPLTARSRQTQWFVCGLRQWLNGADDVPGTRGRATLYSYCALRSHEIPTTSFRRGERWSLSRILAAKNFSLDAMLTATMHEASRSLLHFPRCWWSVKATLRLPPKILTGSTDYLRSRHGVFQNFLSDVSPAVGFPLCLPVDRQGRLTMTEDLLGVALVICGVAPSWRCSPSLFQQAGCPIAPNLKRCTAECVARSRAEVNDFPQVPF